MTEGKASVKVLHTDDRWFGVTYADDKQYVTDALKELHEKKVYGDKLFD